MYVLRTSMYVFMYVCMHACIYVCMYVCTHACIYVCMHVCMYVCMHACIYVYINALLQLAACQYKSYNFKFKIFHYCCVDENNKINKFD